MREIKMAAGRRRRWPLGLMVSLFLMHAVDDGLARLHDAHINDLVLVSEDPSEHQIRVTPR